MEIFKSDNIVIDGKHSKPIVIDYRYYKNDEKSPLILFIHGFKGFKDWGYFNLMADHYARQGFIFVKMNFSHNGTTPEFPTEFHDLEAFGNNNFTKELDDIESVLDYLHSDAFELNHQTDYNKLFIKGHSRGGGVSILKAHEDERINAVISYAGINNLRYNQSEEILSKWKQEGVNYILNTRTNQRMPMYYQIVQDVLNNHGRFDISSIVRRLKKPLLILHGSNDETLPVTMATVMHSWKPDATLNIIGGADHTFGGSHPYMATKLPMHALKAINNVIEFLQQ